MFLSDDKLVSQCQSIQDRHFVSIRKVVLISDSFLDMAQNVSKWNNMNGTWQRIRKWKWKIIHEIYRERFVSSYIKCKINEKNKYAKKKTFSQWKICFYGFLKKCLLNFHYVFCLQNYLSMGNLQQCVNVLFPLCQIKLL